MSVNEFKAWLDGYTQAKKELTSDDIKVIQEKLSTVQDQVRFIPITYPSYPPYWIEPSNPYWEKPGYIPTITRPDTANPMDLTICGNTTGNTDFIKIKKTTGDYVPLPYGSNSTDQVWGC